MSLNDLYSTFSAHTEDELVKACLTMSKMNTLLREQAQHDKNQLIILHQELERQHKQLTQLNRVFTDFEKQSQEQCLLMHDALRKRSHTRHRILELSEASSEHFIKDALLELYNDNDTSDESESDAESFDSS
jgi:hypothetical protein